MGLLAVMKKVLQMTDKNIYQRINSVMKDCTYLQKENAGMGKGVRYDDVIAMLRPLMISEGIVIRVEQISFKLLDGLGGGRQNLFEGLYRLDLINMDNPTDIMSQTATGQGMDAGDKSPGKAQTYAVKTMLVKGFALETGVDEESRAEKLEAIEALISPDQHRQLESLLGEEIDGVVKWNSLHRKVLGAYKIANLVDLPECKFEEVIGRLKNANN